MNEQPMDGARFEDLVAAGVDERTIDVARALASARRAAPASLVGVRWAAVAEVETEGERDVVRPAEPAVSAVAATSGGRQRGVVSRGREWRWWPQLAVGAVAIALVAVLWAWAVPWMAATTVRRPDGVGEERPGILPGEGDWALVDQIGGESLAIARDGPLLLMGRGHHLEAYNLQDLDGEGRPRLLARSQTLPGRPIALALSGGTAFAGLEGTSGLWVFDVATRTRSLFNRRLGTATLRLRDVHETDESVVHVRATTNGRRTVAVGDIAEFRGYGRRLFIAVVDSMLREERVRLIRGAVLDQYGASDITDIALDETIAVISGATKSIIIDIEDPESPMWLSTIDDIGSILCSALDSGRLYLAGTYALKDQDDKRTSGLVVYSLKDPMKPRRLGTYDPANGDNDSQLRGCSLSISDSSLAIALDSFNFEELDVEVVDVSDPTKIESLKVRSGTAHDVILGTDVLIALGEQQGDSVSIIDLNDPNWAGAPTELAPSCCPIPYAPPVLRSPSIQGLVGWSGGVLIHTSDNAVGGQLQYAGSGVEDDLSRASTSRGSDHVHRSLGADRAWPSGQNADRTSFGDPYRFREFSPAAPITAVHAPTEVSPAITYRLVQQSAMRDRAVALLVDYRDTGYVDLGMIAWTPDEDPSIWPSELRTMGQRIARSRYSLTSPQNGAWHLTTDERYAAAVVGLDTARILVWDISNIHRPHLIVNVKDPHPFAYDVRLHGSNVFLWNHDVVRAYAILDGTTATEVYSSDSFGKVWGVEFVGSYMVVLSEDGLKRYPLSREGHPMHRAGETIVPMSEMSTRTPSALSLSAHDGMVYVGIGVDWSNYTDRPRVLEIDVDRRRIHSQLELIRQEFRAYAPRVALDHDRLFVYFGTTGVLVYERRASTGSTDRSVP